LIGRHYRKTAAVTSATFDQPFIEKRIEREVNAAARETGDARDGASAERAVAHESEINLGFGWEQTELLQLHLEILCHGLSSLWTTVDSWQTVFLRVSAVKFFKFFSWPFRKDSCPA